MKWLARHGHWLLTLYVAFVFIQSLFFKFTGSPETVYIFQGKLDPWAASLGFAGVFAPGGIFSAMQGFVSPESFSLIESIMILAMVVLGGMGHIPGVILGAVLGHMLEDNFITSMIKADGNVQAFFERPIAGALGVSMMLIWLWPLLKRALPNRTSA